MSKEKMIKLYDALASAGYNIIKIDSSFVSQCKYYGDTELLLSFTPRSPEPLSEEKMIELIKALYSNGYGILKLEFLFDSSFPAFEKIRLELDRL
ncbi:MAG: hypothetical protein LBV17_03960 [Treponema sp.]|jgi:hypothetical protein|nr:hypothetical protein [Treponema sp.]